MRQQNTNSLNLLLDIPFDDTAILNIITNLSSYVLTNILYLLYPSLNTEQKDQSKEDHSFEESLDMIQIEPVLLQYILIIL